MSKHCPAPKLPDAFSLVDVILQGMKPNVDFVADFVEEEATVDAVESKRELVHKRLRGLYVVTDASAPGGHLAMARAVLQGGARVLQLRDKTASDAQLLPVAREIVVMAQSCGALFLINDRVELALAAGADGVHLGPDDWPISQVRHLMPHGIIGASCGSAEEARRAAANGADTIGAGAVFATKTKSDAGEPIGLQGLREIARATTLPVAAIGGVGLSNIAECLRAGAQMVCVVSALSNARDEAQMLTATRELVARINESAVDEPAE